MYRIIPVPITDGPWHVDLLEDAEDRIFDMRATQSVGLKIPGIEKDVIIRAETAQAMRYPQGSPEFIAELIQTVSNRPDSQEESQGMTWWRIIGRTELIARRDCRNHEVFFGYYDAKRQKGYALIAFEAHIFKKRIGKCMSMPVSEIKIKSRLITETRFEELCLKW